MPYFDDGIPDEAKNELTSSVPLFIRNYWSHPNDINRPYDFRDTSGEETFDYLIDDDSPLYPENWGDINIFLWARGTFKTTSTIGIANWFLYTYPNGEVAMTAPRQEQTREFGEKFRDYAVESGLANWRVKNNVGYQKYKRTIPVGDDDVAVANAEFKTKTAWGEGDISRGIHANIGIMDEFQDIDEGTFSTYLEAISEPVKGNDNFPVLIIIGTPKHSGSLFERLWDMSDKKTWDMEKGEWIQQSKPDTFGNNEDSYEIRGWHIDQLNSPRFSDKEINFKRDEYSERKFKNEVLAEFYTSEGNLLGVDSVKNIIDKDKHFRDRPFREDSTITIGVDWGGGDDKNAGNTVVVVGEHLEVENGFETNIIKIDFLDKSLRKPEEQEVVEDYILKYEADAVLVDEGYGHTPRENLQHENSRIKEEGYHNNVKGIRYSNTSNYTGVKWHKSNDFFTVYKPYQVEDLVDRVRKEKITINGKDLDFSTKSSNGTKVINQLTAYRKEFKENNSGKKKIEIVSESGNNDDLFDAMVYVVLAYTEVSKRQTPTIFRSRKKKGY